MKRFLKKSASLLLAALLLLPAVIPALAVIEGDADGDGTLTLGEVTDYTRAFHEELRETLPDDFPFQVFQFFGEEDTVLFRR